MGISNLKMRNHDIHSPVHSPVSVPVPVAASKSTIGVNYNDVYVLAQTCDEDESATPAPRRKVSQPLALIAYTIHTLGGLDPDPPVPVGAAETKEAAENAIRTTEMRERRMIVSRTGLIRIWCRPWLFNYAWTVYGYDGEQLIDAAYHSINVAIPSFQFSSCTIMMRALHVAGGGGAVVRCIVTDCYMSQFGDYWGNSAILLSRLDILLITDLENNDIYDEKRWIGIGKIYPEKDTLSFIN